MSCTRQTLASCRMGIMAIVVLVLAACSNGGSSGSGATSSDRALSGSVGDGPVINADVVIEDANGVVVGTTTSDANAKYEFTVPQGTPMPLMVRATGGTDLVTGRALDFELVSAVTDDVDSTVNLNPQSTLLVSASQCTGGALTRAGLEAIWASVRGQIGMGLDANRITNPITSQIDATNIADVVLATEALGEAVRRTMNTLNVGAEQPVGGDRVITELACDLAQGMRIDGISTSGISAVGAVYRSAEAAVLLEVIAGDLQVDGASANSLMDAAAQATVSTGESAGRVADVTVSDDLIAQALNTLLLLQSVENSDAVLLSLADTLIDTPPADIRRSLGERLSTEATSSLKDVGLMLANPGLRLQQALVRSAELQFANAAPFISLTAADEELVVGDTASISWASSAANRCVASGSSDWEGPVTLNGRVTVADLQHSTEFALRCYGAGGTNRSTQKVIVTNDQGLAIADPEFPEQTPPSPGQGGDQLAGNPGGPATPPGNPAPGTPNDSNDSTPGVVGDPGSDVSVSLQASATTVATGEFVTLNWNANNAQSCVAQRGWSGSQTLTGNTQVGPITANTTFQLTCQGDAGSASSLVTVNLGVPTIVRWAPPEEYVDGSPVQSLSGFQLFYGTESGEYVRDSLIEDPAATSLSLLLEPGSYYFAMTAISSSGVASELSEEVRITAFE